MALSCLVLSYQILSTVSLTGYHGQDCSGDVDDPPPSVCSKYGQIVTGTEIECSENFDCCLCETISCGTRNKPCDVFSCNGDSSCYGLGDIRIYGSSSEGASIVCNGDLSCNSTVITGQNIAELDCSGDGSCAQSHFEFNCLSKEPCTIGCGGDWACAGIPPESDGPNTHFAITNTAGIECSFEGCQYGTFELTKNKGGGMVMCSGYHSCYGSTIIINNIESIMCGGSGACADAHFVIIDPKEDFEVECAATDACAGMSLEIIVENGVSHFGGIMCGDAACANALITLRNLGNQYLSIDVLECESPGACTNLALDFDGGKGGVGIDDCVCGEEASCDGITGVDACISGLEKVECQGTESCANLEQQVANVANDFELVCGSKRSCKGFWLQILLNNNMKEATTSLKGYKCSKKESCADAIIHLDNQQRDGIEVEVDRIECSGTRSCQNAKFVVSGDGTINEVECKNNAACDGCVVEYAQSGKIKNCINVN